MARQALQDLNQLHQREGLSLADPRFALWDRRQVEALRAAGATQAEFIAALEAYVRRLKELERLVQTTFQNGEANRLDLHDAQYRTLDAEMWLNREKAR